VPPGIDDLRVRQDLKNERQVQPVVGQLVDEERLVRSPLNPGALEVSLPQFCPPFGRQIGFFGKRRVVSYGWRYDFNEGGLKPTDPIPEFLLSVRGRAAAFAARPASSCSCSDSSRGVPSGLNGRRSTTLNMGCSSLISLHSTALRFQT